MGKLRLKETANLLKVLCAGLLHLYLNGSVLRVYIVEKFLAGFAGIHLNLVVEILVHMLQNALLRDFESKVVKSGKLIVDVHSRDSLFKCRGSVEKNGTKVEVISQ